jgi:hypothetical protein
VKLNSFMATLTNDTVTRDLITVHGRGSLTKAISYRDKASEQFIDIANRVLFFEIDGVSLRVELAAGADDFTRIISLTTDHIETLGPKATQFSLRDETAAANGKSFVVWAGQIKRAGFKGAPDEENEVVS